MLIGLMLGLEDSRFEVRFHCARALAGITHGDERLHVNDQRVFDVVRQETTVGKIVWESQRLLHDSEPDDEEDPLLDDFVRDRASRSLAHVFTLLSVALPAVPIKVAFRGLHTDDQGLRGTALEYLEGVLPPPIRVALWPYLEDSRDADQPVRRREQVVADLLQSNQSIVLNLEEIRRRTRGGSSDADGSAKGP